MSHKLLATLALALCLGLLAWAPARAQEAAFLDLFPQPQTQGEIAVNLHINPQVLNRVVVVSFGVPFPPGFLQDTSQVSLRDDSGQEMPISVTELARWPQTAPHGGGIRAVMVQMRDLYMSADPREYTLSWGSARTANESKTWPARTDWVEVSDGSYPAGAISEPAVYALLPPAWLGQCLLKGRTNPVGTQLDFEWYETYMARYYLTAVNQVDDLVPAEKRIDYVGQYGPWLFDRATTLFMVYFRQGALDNLRQAHRAAQYYASQIQPDGRFGLKQDKDGKYNYQECLALDYWLTGDSELLPVSERVRQAMDWWNPIFQTKNGQGFWTERHYAYWLLNALVSYEITGDSQYLDKAKAAVDSAVLMLSDPPPGAPRDFGCLIHSGRQHGEGFDLPFCSPWMTQLAADALMRYYIVTGDQRIPGMMISMADFMAKSGIRSYYTGSTKPPEPPFTAPFYWVVPGHPERNGDAKSTDFQHCPDTLGLMALGKYFATKTGQPKPEWDEPLANLTYTAKKAFTVSYYEQGPKYGRPKARLSPPRMFNWWFRTTAGMDWYLHQ